MLVWGKSLITKGEISPVISFPSSSNRFGVFWRQWGWMSVGTEDVERHEAFFFLSFFFLNADTTGKPV